MKKKTLIIIIICVLVALVIALCVFGVIGPQGSTPIASLADYTRSGDVPTVSPPNTIPDIGTPWDQSFPTDT